MAATRERSILQTSFVTGVAMALSVGVGIARMKAAAVLVGPEGLGTAGLYQRFIALGAVVFGFGISSMGTRHVAAAAEDGKRLPVVVRALSWGSLLLGGLAILTAWLGHGAIERRWFDGLATPIEWLGVGVAISVLGTGQMAQLTGLRQTEPLAVVRVGGAVLSGVLGVAVLFIAGQAGMVWFVLSAPLASVLISSWFVLRQPSSGALPAVITEWKTMALFGATFVITSVIGAGSDFATSAIIADRLGKSGLGQVQASWLLSVTYLSFILQAMGQDFLPRLTAVVSVPEKASAVVNEQLEVALLLSAPAFMVVLGFSDVWLHLFYSASFSEASSVLRWQVLADTLKVAGWPLGYVLIAAGASRAVLFTEVTTTLLLLGVTSLLLPSLGVQAVGVASLAAYVFYFPAVLWLSRAHGVVVHARNWRLLGAVGGGALLVFASASVSVVAGRIIGGVLTLAVGLFSLRRLHELASMEDFGVSRIRSVMKKLMRK